MKLVDPDDYALALFDLHLEFIGAVFDLALDKTLFYCCYHTACFVDFPNEVRGLCLDAVGELFY